MHLRKYLSPQKIELILFYLFILFLPTQLGKHFWPDFALISGIRIDYLSPTVYFTDLIILLWVIVRMRIVLPAFRSKVKHYKKQIELFAGFVAFLVLNIFLSGNVPNGFYHLVKFFEFSFVAYAVVGIVGKRASFETIAAVFAVCVIGESILAIAQFFNQGSLGGLLYYIGERSFTASTPGIANASVNGELILRPYGTFSHPNVLAGYLVVSMILIAFFLFSGRQKYSRPLAIVALLLGTTALFLTLSRVATLFWAAVSCYMFFKMAKRYVLKVNKNYSSFITGIILVAIFVIGLSLLYLFTPVGARFFETRFTEEAASQRSALLAASAIMFSQSPLVGVGFGSFIPQLDSPSSALAVGYYLQPVHNIFLLVAAETGLIGFGCFLYFLLKTFSRVFLFNKKKALCLLLMLGAIIILGMVDHYWLTLQQGQLLFALVIGLCFSRPGKDLSFARRENYPKLKN